MAQQPIVTAAHVEKIGTLPGTDPNVKNNPDLQHLQAFVNLTDVLKLMTMVLIDIRDGRKAT